MLKKQLNRRIILVLVLLAAILRLYGINHGLPFIYHVDEPTVVRSALALRFNLNPKHFDWPHLYFYLNYIVYLGFAKVRGLLESTNFANLYVLKWMWIEPSVFYTLSRIFSAILGTLTVIPMYLMGRELFNKKVGMFACAFLAVLPFHVRQSHYALVDVPMLFFLSISLYFAAKTKKLPNPKFYALAGLFMGLAISTKYNAFLGGVFFLIMQLPMKNTLKRLSGVFTYGFFSVLGFIIGTPFAIIDSTTFMRRDNAAGALWQLTNVGRVKLQYLFPQFITGMVNRLPDDFGYTLWLLFIVSAVIIGITQVKNRKTLSVEFLIALASLLLIGYICGQEKYRSHYFMPVYPYVILTASYGLYVITNYLKPRLQLGLLLLIFIPPLVLSVLTVTSLITRVGLVDYSLVNNTK